jgi:hypothetical protein
MPYSSIMRFDSTAYGPEVAAILAFDGKGERPMALAEPACSSGKALAALKSLDGRRLFATSRAPDAAMAGLYLYFGCWQEAHETAQNIHTPDGSYWHAIVHRQEPDPWNSDYWFRQVGRHPIFPALRDAAAALGVDFGPEWRPGAFIQFCEKARSAPGSEIERQALAVQQAEWQLLFDYCAATAQPPR